MLKFLNNDKLTIIFLSFSLIAFLLLTSEASSREKSYIDKLELIRDFIVANYPVNPEHFIKIETVANIKWEAFWQFSVDVGDLNCFWTPEKREPIIDEQRNMTRLKEVKPELSFLFNIEESCGLLDVFAKGPKIEEKLIIIKEILKKEKEFTLEKIETLLNNMNALYPIDLKKAKEIKETSYSIVAYFNEDITEKIKTDLLNKKSLWNFISEKKPIIKEVTFSLVNSKEPFSIGWDAIVIIDTAVYIIHMEPFNGYIINIQRWPNSISK